LNTHASQRVMSICCSRLAVSTSANVHPSALFARPSVDDGGMRFLWRAPADRNVAVQVSLVLHPRAVETWKPPAAWTGISLCPDVAMRQLSNVARLDNFGGAATLRLRHSARSCADGDERLCSMYWPDGVDFHVSFIVNRTTNCARVSRHTTNAACSTSAELSVDVRARRLYEYSLKYSVPERFPAAASVRQLQSIANVSQPEHIA